MCLGHYALRVAVRESYKNGKQLRPMIASKNISKRRRSDEAKPKPTKHSV